jgi:hypothetical protein
MLYSYFLLFKRAFQSGISGTDLYQLARRINVSRAVLALCMSHDGESLVYGGKQEPRSNK